MNKNYSYEECYEILSIDPGCSWPELRKCYKSLIQKWHPDRHNDNSNDKQTATIRIKEINLAYQQLEDYYKEQGILPQCTYSKSEDELHRTTYSSPITPEQHDTPSTPETPFPSAPPPSSRKSLRTWGITLVLVIYVSFLVSQEIIRNNQMHEDGPTTAHMSSQKETSIFSESTHTLNSTTATPTVNFPDIAPKHDAPFFTYNSTIGEVISIQGQPDLIINNTWYYGKSEVHFRDGRVIRWSRAPGSPLNARITEK